MGSSYDGASTLIEELDMHAHTSPFSNEEESFRALYKVGEQYVELFCDLRKNPFISIKSSENLHKIDFHPATWHLVFPLVHTSYACADAKAAKEEFWRLYKNPLAISFIASL